MLLTDAPKMIIVSRYAGIPSKIVSVLDAVHEDASLLGATVLYEEGTTDVAPLSSHSIATAAAAAKQASLTILAVRALALTS